MKRFKELLLIAGLSTLSLSGAFALWRFPLERVSAQSSEDHVIYLNQGWSPEVQEAYYHLSQGSTVMPYDVFLNLEAAGSQDLFRSDANSERYGLTPDPVNPRTNPDGLQIGLSKTTTQEGPWKGDDVGLTCASPICGSLTRLTTFISERSENTKMSPPLPWHGFAFNWASCGGSLRRSRSRAGLPGGTGEPSNIFPVM